MGDFNINLLNTETNTYISEFHDNMPFYFFDPYILQPTRLTKNSKTLIDNISQNFTEFDFFRKLNLSNIWLPSVAFNTKRFSSQIYCNK